MPCTSTDSTGTVVAEGFNDQVLDTEALQRLTQLDSSGKHSIVQRVLIAYERALGQALRELETAIAVHDLRTVARVAHTLRSSSISVGAMGLSTLCGDVESAIRDGRFENLKPRLRELEQESRHVVVAVRQLLVARGYAN